jgi:hypothetical protein
VIYDVQQQSQPFSICCKSQNTNALIVAFCCIPLPPMTGSLGPQRGFAGLGANAIRASTPKRRG